MKCILSQRINLTDRNRRRSDGDRKEEGIPSEGGLSEESARKKGALPPLRSPSSRIGDGAPGRLDPEGGEHCRGTVLDPVLEVHGQPVVDRALRPGPGLEEPKTVRSLSVVLIDALVIRVR